ncbi:hypothetical protein pb186bvf_005602 [Paramecium bursaria]
MPNYGEKSYWDLRYSLQDDELFDWLEDYNSLKPILMQILKPEHQIMNLGCGNSELSEKLYEDGFTKITNIDISDRVIEKMKNRNRQTDMSFQVMDAMNMTFANNTFDIIIDKSTIDAILCGENAFLNVAKMLFEGLQFNFMFKIVQRVLVDGGIYIAITYGEPNTRQDHFDRKFLHFDVSVQLMEKEVFWQEGEEINKHKLQHFIYFCRKKPHVYEQILEVYYDSLLQLEQIDEEQSEEQDLLEQWFEQYKIKSNTDITFEQFVQKLQNDPNYELVLKELGYF